MKLKHLYLNGAFKIMGAYSNKMSLQYGVWRNFSAAASVLLKYYIGVLLCGQDFDTYILYISAAEIFRRKNRNYLPNAYFG